MNKQRVSIRHLIAGVGVLSIALVGFIGSSAAMAGTGGDAVPGNIDTSLTGSLTIHKHVTDASSTDTHPAGTPLAGVQFQIQHIDGIDLTKQADWTTIQAAYASQPNAAPVLTGLVVAASTITVDPTNALGVTVIDDLAVGAYLVTEVGAGGNLITAPALPFIITVPQSNANGTWDYNVDAYPKNNLGAVTPTKVAGDPANNVGLNQALAWTITAPVPASTLDYNQFGISDSVGAGLAFVSWGAVMVGATPLTVVTDYTIDPVTHAIAFTAAGLLKLNAQAMNGPVSVTAVVNTTVTNVGSLTNSANITVNGTTHPTNGKTNWGAIDITKVDSTNVATTLAGATFELYAADGAGAPTGSVLQTITTLADGKAHFDVYIGKDAVVTKKFVVVETVAPQGYVLPANPRTVFDVTAGETVTASTATANIQNFKPVIPKLPLTGSTGTLLFIIVGLGLVGAGGGLMVARRSRSKA